MRIAVNSFLLTYFMAAGFAATAQAATIPFFYTTASSPDVFSASYNATTNGITGTTAIATSQQGADGVLAGPNSTLFFTGEGGNGVYQIPQAGGAPLGFSSGTTPSYLLAMNQNNPNTVFTFNNAGSVATLPVNGGVLQSGTAHTITGPVTNVSNLVWSAGNTAYYVTGQPGATGSLGVFNTSGFSTNTQLFSGINTAQDAVFDPFTGLIVLFGNGQVDTFNPATNTLGTAVALPGATVGGSCGSGSDQFNAGTVDGAGHALVGGCGQLSYIDYSKTGNILSASDVRQSVDGFGGKDIAALPAIGGAPAVGEAPEVSSMGLVAFGLALLAFGRSRRKKPL
ncbi:MAG TPA: hypothetical protein VK604_26305 [Bryobacteraceae bacterium]|nr:hypothetical protein [Bryobacteraceae bacterium]